MMREFLLFDLYGAMASWGEAAVGEIRPTATHPTRSAVLGFLACCMGVPRTDSDRLAQLDDDVRFAVRVDGSGSGIRDYQTIQAPDGTRGRDLGSRKNELEYDRIATTLTYRSYRADGLWLVAVWSNNPERLEELQQALKTPGFIPYLGRKSCPTALPCNPRLRKAESLRHLMESEPIATPYPAPTEPTKRDPRSLFARALSVGPVAEVFWEGDESGFDEYTSQPRNDRLLSRARWQFGKRDEHRATVRRPILSEEEI